MPHTANPDDEPPGPDEHDADLFDADGEPSDDLVGCPNCGEPIFPDAERCPECGHWISPGDRSEGEDGRQRLWKWIVGLLVVMLLLWLVLY